MIRKTLSFLLALTFLFCFPSVGYAVAENPSVIDSAGLLTAEEEEALTREAESIRQTFQIDVVILTVDSLDGARPQDYADDYYDGHGYGEDGLLFLISMEERDWYISTSGSVIYALTDYGIAQIADTALPCLSDGAYYQGFSAFLNALPTFLDAQADGTPIDGHPDYSGSDYHGDQESVVISSHRRAPNWVLSIVIGLVAAGATIVAMVSMMNTKRRQPDAGSYLTEGSYHLRTQRDLFLFSNVSKTARPKDTGSSGGSGSSVHHSSSGRSHGGGGGKF